MNAPPPDNPDEEWHGGDRRHRQDATHGTYFEVRAMREEMRGLREEMRGLRKSCTEHAQMSANNFHKITRLEEIISGEDGVAKRLKFIVEAMPKLLMSQNIVFGTAAIIGAAFMAAVVYLIGWKK